MCIEKTPWEQVIEFHGHTCTEIALGYRVAQIANRELGVSEIFDPMIKVTAYIHSCALDAFQIINRATYGRNSLFVEEQNIHSYVFQTKDNAEKLQITVTPKIIEIITESAVSLGKRERQAKTIEAIKVILGAEEALFCEIKHKA
ncbi:formylmethanofuran dehydrogenase subunit E family protein [Desulfosporosinus meridiei]|uniref:Formylmethanofuran dehydrogenase subunit E n=1 Tax=Desulfosporosinus meridiei (strain ATCC BAA-275 / DSM 13257 / KCTC 12902 / NCIMB 13706 / S10) TaxID=768704 RepID=J7IS90_DESMD|nr:formylmethanofuran dehydrogenase subunit E family protein [Desulfosporosinus meridiei]AFQ44530.1 formylmethanofuran dehydrogenase subunit E [Desulfosporosinus meridiei DSM 13257]